MTPTTKGFLLVRAGGRQVGLPLADVLQVIALGEVHPVPVVEPSVRGVVAVQGRMLPLVHLASLLEGGSQPRLQDGVGVVVSVEGRRMCLEVEDADLMATETALPVPPGETMPWAVGVVRHPDGLVPLLDLTTLSSRLMEAAWK